MDGETFAFEKDLPQALRETMRGALLRRRFAAGHVIHQTGEDCLGLIRVLSGRVRVVMLSRDGREVTLYFLEAGDEDVLSAFCVIRQLTFRTQMIAESDAELLILPACALAELTAASVHARCHALEIGNLRFSDVMWTLQQILFWRLDQRIASRLLDEQARTGSDRLQMTQETLARDVHTAREVVSRTLRGMEREGLLRTARGQIEILDDDGLTQLLEG